MTRTPGSADLGGMPPSLSNRQNHDIALELLAVAALIYALAFLPAFAAQAQGGPEEIEAALAGAVGQERLEMLETLVTAYREENAARSVELGQEALELLRAHPDRARQLEILNSLAYAHVILGNHASALELGSRARELARAAGNAPAHAFALRSIGRVHRSSSAYENALEVYRQSAELYARPATKRVSATR